MKSVLLFSLGLVSFSEALSFKNLASRGLDTKESDICYVESFGRYRLATCSEGQSIGSNCYGSCPDGWGEGDSEGFPSDDHAFTGEIRPLTWCWGGCPEGFDLQWDTCVKLTSYGSINFMSDRAFDGSRFDDNQATCEKSNPQGCEECDTDQWVPKSDCGSCSLYCPITCPDGYEQVDDHTCKMGRVEKPILGAAVCPDGYTLEPPTYDNEFAESGEIPCYHNAPEAFTCDQSLCLAGCPEGWKQCGDSICVSGDQCTEDLRDAAFNLSASLYGLASGLTDPSQGDTVSYVNVPEADKTYSFCQ